MKKVLGTAVLFSLLLVSQFSFAKEFKAGFNQGWITGKYGTQWVNGFNASEFRRMMTLTKQANGNILRFWLFEGFQSDALLFNQYSFEGLNPRFVENLKVVLQAAKEEGVQLNLTLLDGNIGQNKPPSQQFKDIWWSFLNNSYSARQDFINKVYIPLLQILALPEYAGVVTQLDVANEINVFTFSDSEVRNQQGWAGINQLICDFYQVKNQIAPFIEMTASLGWSSPESTILNNRLNAACVDFFDVHYYDNGGNISQCQALAQYAHSLGKKVQLGEFGQGGWFSKHEDDSLQSTVTQRFLTNAYNCGFDGALAWRLTENEPDSYLAYERNGRLRPGYYSFQQTVKALLNL